MCLNARQVCSLGARILVEHPIHEAVVAGLKEEIRVGPGTEAVSMGPVTTAPQYEKVQEYYRIARAHRGAARLEAGQVFVNECFAGGVETPVGGYKMSGYGREKGIETLHHYTQLKCVTIKL